MIGKGRSVHCQELVAWLVLLIGIVVDLVLYFFTNVMDKDLLIFGCVGGGIYVLYLMIGFICNPYCSSFTNMHHG
jgi:hypothetical protein